MATKPTAKKKATAPKKTWDTKTKAVRRPSEQDGGADSETEDAPEPEQPAWVEIACRIRNVAGIDELPGTFVSFMSDVAVATEECGGAFDDPNMIALAIALSKRVGAY